MKIKLPSILILIVIVGLGFIFQHKHYNDFPSHIHAWAQSDRYALSLGFLENGFNFLKPETFVYNHQFPDNWEVASTTTITAVNFPIHDFIAAVFMKISGNTSPGVFRMYVLFYSFLGMFFLFKLSHAISQDYIKSAFIVVFSATSPIFVYYQAGFLPTIPSLSNTIIGLYFYHKFLDSKNKKDFWLAIGFLTLAALSRTTFAIPIIAVLGVEFIRIIKKETPLAPKLLPVALSIMTLMLYFLYNGYLRETYGSIFLNYFLPPSSFNEVQDLLSAIYTNWFYDYFSQYHYFILAVVMLMPLYFTLFRRNHRQSVKKNFSLFTTVYILGCSMFTILMFKQFRAHDYYFLDTFYLPIVLTLTLVLSTTPAIVKTKHKVISTFFVLAAGVILVIPALKSQEKRRLTGTWDRTEAAINNFSNSSVFLDAMGIPRNAKILVIDAIAPNIPFILMKRKGYAVINSNEQNIKKALTWDFDYIVTQNEFFSSDIYREYPEILKELNKVADNGKISVSERTKNNDQSLSDFLGLDKMTPVLEEHVSFEEKTYGVWKNISRSNKHAYEGAFSGHLEPEMEYGISFKSKNLTALQAKSRTLYFSSYFFSNSEVDCEIVVSLNANGQNLYYKSNNLNDFLHKDAAWESVSLTFPLPQVKNNDFEFAIYIWNVGNSALYYDNFEFSIY